ncbi:glycosyltransferase [Arthrobacter sp. lap29]|uniref:glycosyltransferase n=1 Tax=Arthrobacter sp. lap29 TaxID=3056122 RepID=UPI0028F6FF45|nr:glycosyltransferase [Arthrobacter sp. lap29]
MTNLYTEKPLLVDLVLRRDAFTKEGGDVIQALHYAQVLESLGDDVRVVAYSPNLAIRRDSIVHYFNMDRNFEFLAVARLAAGHVFFISTIHHGKIYVESMRRAQRLQTGQKIVAFLSENTRSLAVFLLRTWQADSTSFTHRAKSGLQALRDCILLRSNICKVLESADGIFLLSNIERNSIISEFSWHGRNATITPNGKPAFEYSVVENRTGILVVGRIESRKRQLDIAKTAIKRKVPITFIGTRNYNERKYVEEFENLVRSCDILNWIPGLPHEEVLNRMRSSIVLLNCSWVEVQSLVDLEAVFSGCHVVSLANGGSSKEWLGNAVTEVLSGGIDEVLKVAQAMITSCSAPEIPSYSITWDLTTESIRNEYIRALNTRPYPVGHLG